ncbi:MAG: hypothetical protein WCO98_06890 [bacterium]
MIVFGILSLLIVILMFIKGVPFIMDQVYPLTTKLTAYCVPACVLIGLVTMAIRRARWISSVVFSLASAVCGFSLWVWCLAVVKVFWGTFWTIVGCSMYGIGVVPMAFLATLFKGQWEAFWTIIIFAVITFVLQYVGIVIGEWWLRTCEEDL